MNRSFSTVVDAVVHTDRTVAENWVKRRGEWKLFVWTRSLPGFAENEAAWEREKLRPILQKTRLERSGATDGLSELVKLLFLHMEGNPKLALQKNADLIRAKAAAGDAQFFDQLGAKLRNLKQRRNSGSRQLQFDVLNYWVHGFLWMMDTRWGSAYLEKSLRRPVSEGAYIQCLRRLKLRPAAPPYVTGLNKGHTFIWRKGLQPPQQ